MYAIRQLYHKKPEFLREKIAAAPIRSVFGYENPLRSPSDPFSVGRK